MNVNFSGITVKTWTDFQDMTRYVTQDVMKKSPLWFYTFDPKNGDLAFFTGKDAKKVAENIGIQQDPKVFEPDPTGREGMKLMQKTYRDPNNFFNKVLASMHLLQQYYVERQKAGADIEGNAIQKA